MEKVADFTTTYQIAYDSPPLVLIPSRSSPPSRSSRCASARFDQPLARLRGLSQLRGRLLQAPQGAAGDGGHQARLPLAEGRPGKKDGRGNGGENGKEAGPRQDLEGTRGRYQKGENLGIWT